MKWRKRKREIEENRGLITEMRKQGNSPVLIKASPDASVPKWRFLILIELISMRKWISRWEKES